MNNTLRLASVFALSSAMALLTACGRQGPYTNDAPTQQTTVKQVDGVSHQQILSGDFAETLDDGAYVITFKDSGASFLVVKDKDQPALSYAGYGYFGMTDIGQEFVPSRQADVDNGNLSLWKIQSGDIVEQLEDGVYTMTFAGEVLNGQDIQVMVIKDRDSPSLSYQGYGYLGLSTMPSQAVPAAP